MVVAANSWMNQPGGFTMDAAGNVTDVDVWSVIFNDAVKYEFPHMYFAAFVSAGFLVASPYAVGMLRGRRDRYHRLGFLLPFTIAAIADPDPDGHRRLDRPGDLQRPADQVRGAGAQHDHRLGQARDPARAPERGRRRSAGGFDDPGARVVPERSRAPARAPSCRASTRCRPRTSPRSRADQHGPPGLGPDGRASAPRSFLLALWFAWIWWRRRERARRDALVPARGGRSRRSPPTSALESGWIVTEVGRQPWIVYEILRTEDAVTDAGAGRRVDLALGDHGALHAPWPSARCS